LLIVGRLVARKGIADAIAALARIPDAELLVVGGPAPDQLAEDEEARRLRAVALAHGVGDRVRLLGQLPHPELPAILRSGDLLLAVPWYEPFGIAPLEAMACGLPVVATAVGGLRDTVLDGLTGRLVAPRQPAQLAQTVNELLADRRQRAAMARAGRERVLTYYGWNSVAEQTEACYRNVLAERAPASRQASGRPMTELLNSTAQAHLDALRQALAGFGPATDIALRWGIELAEALTSGARLLVAGNGGSAAQAQHLSAEIVGRYRRDRAPFSAVALHSDPSALTAILNDFGIEEVFARQVQAHGRPGDICVLMSTSGQSPNVLAAAERARECGLRTWAMTGAVPNRLAALTDEVLPICSPATATVQELHLVALHLICESMDDELARRARTKQWRNGA
jgi:type III pantothenate kinase